MNTINTDTMITSYDLQSLISYCMNKGIPRYEAIRISKESIKAARHNTGIMSEYVNGAIQIFRFLERKQEEHKELEKRIFKAIGKKRKLAIYDDIVFEYK